MTFSILLVLVGGVAMYWAFSPLGAAVILVADVYLVLMLWCATRQSANKPQTWPGLPMRESAVVVVPLVFAALVLAFAAAYRNYTPDIHTRLGATYFSFVNLGSFTYDAAPGTSHTLRFVMAIQLFSGILLLICALPLLVSRLTNLDRAAG